MRATPRTRRTLLSIAAVVALTLPAVPPASAFCADPMPCCDDIVVMRADGGCCDTGRCPMRSNAVASR